MNIQQYTALTRPSIGLKRLASLHARLLPAFHSATASQGFQRHTILISHGLSTHTLTCENFGLHLLSTVGHYIRLSLLGKEKEKLSFSFRKRPLTLPNTISAF